MLPQQRVPTSSLSVLMSLLKTALMVAVLVAAPFGARALGGDTVQLYQGKDASYWLSQLESGTDQYNTVAAMHTFGEQILPHLRILAHKNDKDVRERACAAIAAVGAPAASAICQMLIEGPIQGDIIARAVARQKENNDLIEAVFGALCQKKGEDDEVLRALRRFDAGCQEDAAVLCRATRYGDALIRRAAVRILCLNAGTSDVIDATLIGSLREDEDVGVRAAAAACLKSELPAILKARVSSLLLDASEHVRVVAAESFGRNKEHSDIAIQGLISALHDRSPLVQRTAARVLAVIGGEDGGKAVPALYDVIWATEYHLEELLSSLEKLDLKAAERLRALQRNGLRKSAEEAENARRQRGIPVPTQPPEKEQK